MRRLFSFVRLGLLLQPLAPSPAADVPPRVHPELEAWAIRAARANGFGGELAAPGQRAGSALAPVHADRVPFADPMDLTVVRARRYARRAMALLRLYRRRMRQAGELRQLGSIDAATLRDLGLTRSEIGSIYAEAIGRAAPTRRAIVEHEWFRLRTGVPVQPGAAF